MEISCECGLGHICRKPPHERTGDDERAIFNRFLEVELDRCIRFIFARYTQELESAQDLFQDAIIDAWESRDEYDPAKAKVAACPFRNWIYLKVRNKGSRFLSDVKRNGEAREPLPGLFDEFISNYAELKKKLQSCLICLPKRQKESVELCIYQQMSYEEACRRSIWPCKPSTMRQRFFQAKESLIKCLEKRGEL